MKLLSFFRAASVVLAQEAQQGSISGYASDSSQAMMARVRVTVTNRDTDVSRTDVTNASGLYNFVGLNPGDYNISATVAGFKTEERPRVQLDTGARLRIDFAMEVGSTQETIRIAADAAILNTESGEVSTLISGTQVTELALNGRNFTQFLMLGTGVV